MLKEIGEDPSKILPAVSVMYFLKISVRLVFRFKGVVQYAHFYVFWERGNVGSPTIMNNTGTGKLPSFRKGGVLRQAAGVRVDSA